MTWGDEGVIENSRTFSHLGPQNLTSIKATVIGAF